MKTVNTKGMTIFQPSCGNYNRGIVRTRSYFKASSAKRFCFMQYNLCGLHLDVFSQLVSCGHTYMYVLNVRRSK